MFENNWMITFNHVDGICVGIRGMNDVNVLVKTLQLAQILHA